MTLVDQKSCMYNDTGNWNWARETISNGQELFWLAIGPHTHSQPFYSLLSGTTQEGRYKKRPSYILNVLWESVIILDFMKHGEDNRSKCWTSPHPDHRCPHLHQPPNFTPDALPATSIPIYPGLGQAPNMLDCTPGSYQS